MKLLFFCLANILIWLHPLHVSVTEIEMDRKDKTLEIVMRVFVDDLELALRKKYNQPELDVLHPRNGLTLDQMMTSYLHDHVTILLEGKPQAIRYIGHEKEDDAFIFYSEVTDVKKWQTIVVQNDILTEIHDDQSNLVHITVDSEVRSLRLTRENPKDKLTFNSK